jgi:hypothetical protein
MQKRLNVLMNVSSSHTSLFTQVTKTHCSHNTKSTQGASISGVGAGVEIDVVVVVVVVPPLLLLLVPDTVVDDVAMDDVAVVDDVGVWFADVGGLHPKQKQTKKKKQMLKRFFFKRCCK